ncbi:MAG: polysaccharide pyruvyl transferase family protein, partial [Planctomycetota bacterium]
RLPTVFYACGVTIRGSAGAPILSRCLRDPLVKAIFLRDERSLIAMRELRARSGEIPQPRHAFDPAIHVAEAYSGRLVDSKDIDVGVNFTDPVNMTYSSGRSLSFVDSLDSTLSAVVRHFVDSGKRVALFTNGAVEDEEFLQQCDQRFGLSSLPSVTRLSRPLRPEQLVQSIHRMRSVIAHRLHTNIIAYGLKIPSVGLEWSEKVPDFFRLVKRESCLVGKEEMFVESILDRHQRLSTLPVDESFLAEIKATSLQTFGQALRDIGVPNQRC